MGPEILRVQQCDVHVTGLRNALWIARNGGIIDYRLLIQIVAFYYKWCGEPWEEFEQRCDVIFSLDDILKVDFHWQA